MNKSIVIGIISLLVIGCSPKISPDAYWGSQRWVLVEMKEVPVQLSGGSRDAFVEFIPSDKRFSGNAGCNRMNGNYAIEKRTRIKFSEVITTKMSCPDIAFETAFLSALNEVNRFESDGSTIRLKDDRKTLLVFQRRL